MKVIPYSKAYLDQWNDFVVNHPYAWVGHHSSIFDIEKEIGGKNCSYVLVDEKKNLLGIIPMFLHKERTKRVFKSKILSSGSFLRSGPLFDTRLSKKQEAEALDEFVSKLVRRAKSMKIDNIMMSYPTMHGDETSLEYYEYLPLKKYGFRERNLVSMVKDLGFEEETLFQGLRSSCRQSIRRCIKEGGRSLIVEDRSTWMKCYDLNLQTFKDVGCPPITKRTMEILWDSFVEKGIAEVTATKFKGKLTNVMLTGVLGKSCYYWFGFNGKPFAVAGGSNLLVWNTMLYFKGKGIRYFHMGSREFSNPKQIRISRYKESFGGKNCYELHGNLNLRPIKHCSLELLHAIWVRCRNGRTSGQ